MNAKSNRGSHTHRLLEPPDSQTDIGSWRRQQRERLQKNRNALGCREQVQASKQILDTLRSEIDIPTDSRLGFYWPINGEIDVRPLIREFLNIGVQAALPVIVAKNAAMEFWHWDARTKLCSRGLWGIPAPVERILLSPTVLFVPLLGFDDQGHRLGHGGGYYDRTLAILDPEPLKIGIGHESGRLPTIHPLAHDVPMDATVTEAGINWHADKRTS